MLSGDNMSKSENLVLRIDKETKNFFKKKADSRGVSLTRLIMGLISDGERFENERCEKIRRLAVHLNN
jgi:hypothetical protein